MVFSTYDVKNPENSRGALEVLADERNDWGVVRCYVKSGSLGLKNFDLWEIDKSHFQYNVDKVIFCISEEVPFEILTPSL
jgi:hypothetical protein